MTMHRGTLPQRGSLLLPVVLLGAAMVVVVLLVLALLGPAVGNVFSDIVSNYSGGPVAPVQPAPPGPASLGLTTERLILRHASLTLIVEDPLVAQRSIMGMVAEMGGEGAFIVSSTEWEGEREGPPEISISIRVPATRYEEAIDRITELAVRIHNRTESAEDVTDEYVDLDARLEALEAARERLLGIMEASSTTEALLLAEQQLTQREAEIESIRGRMQYLSQSARLSDIEIELRPYFLTQPVDARWRPAETVRRSFDTLLDGLRGFADFLIFFGIAMAPWILLVGGVGYGAFRVISRQRARRPREKPAGTQR